MQSRRKIIPNILVAAFLGLMAMAAAPQAMAQNYPNHTIELVVGFPPGGPSDIVARIVGDRLGKILGQAVIIENKPGAGGNIAAGFVAHAPADGYTLLMGNNSILATNAALYRDPGFDAIKDFAPIGLIGTQPNILVVNNSLPVHSVSDLIKLAQTEPGQLNFASSGIGTAAHMAGELFQMQAGINIVHVPYPGAAAALTDLVSGQVQMMFATSASVIPFIKGGQVRALAVTTATRSELVPNLPTVADEGLPDFEATTWHGLVAPAGTPPAIIDRLNKALHAALSDPTTVKRLNGLGVEVTLDSPQQFQAYIKSETVKWTGVVKRAGLHIQ
jgi:tripartite-type tricarboxylate transporter receptor subunit TctC